MKHALELTVNGTPRTVDVESHTSLLTLLREQLELTGTKRGCEEGECGGCSVLLDGALVDSCLIFAVEAQGRAVTTVEGLKANGALSPLQDAFQRYGAAQCGICTPGVLATLTELLDTVPDPTEQQVREWLSGNICRCTGYQGIVDAALAAARTLAAARALAAAKAPRGEGRADG